MLRWVTGILAAAIVIILVLYLPPLGISGIVLIISLITFHEFYSLYPQKKKHYLVLFCILHVALSSCFIFLDNSLQIFPLLLTSLLILVSLIHFPGAEPFEEKVSHLFFLFFALLYTSLLPAHWVWIRALDNWDFYLFLVLASTFASDTGAYIFGKSFGKHKLSPKLSPGKTIEGFLGGWLTAILAAFIVRYLFWADFSISHLLILSSLIAIVGPVGDLSESMFKRAFHIKDSGKIIPGHGGILDRIDALLFSSPMAYYYIIYFIH